MNKYFRPELVLPFGKHKGKKMEELPSFYLQWLAENISEDSEFNKTICYTADRLYQESSDS